ncbi:MAG: MBL fold metallo-hydrolase [Candidatus Methanoperedens sp.]|nr:MBL fold metallo-hydrolase [Candidatus Methanoperedens sp.]MCZ7395612.1 MBL fold metallo-hydrolase [Candidatus Methanoperedens sp.]
MNLRFLGGAREVGRSAVLINEELLLDYGIKPTDPPTYPSNGLRPKTLIISHGHLDHCGLVPNLMDLEPEIYCTSLTAKLSALLARDTLKIAENKGHVIPYYIDEIQEFERKAKAIEYREEFETSGYSACLFDAGHIPGSSSVYIEKDKQSLFYTGDINTIETELQRGADTEYPESDVLMIESTYFGKNHTPRKILEERFIESISETIESGGKAIIPAFSIGRTQEMMLILKKHGLHAYVDGMGVDVFDIIKRKPQSVRDMNKLEKAFSSSSIVKPEERAAIIKEPCIIVTSAGMLNGGPVLYYLREIHDDPKSKLHLTGYQAEDTNGRRALQSGYIEDGRDTLKLNCRLEQYDFSAHCGDKELKEVVKKFADNGTETVFAVHGENTQGFAEWIGEELDVESKAPANGDRIYI